MDRVRASLQRMLDAHHPYPGVVIDRQWNVLASNDAALMLMAGLPTHLLEPNVNVFRVCLHPEGLASRTTNFAEWGTYLLQQIRRSIQLTQDPALEELEVEISQYPNIQALDERGIAGRWEDPPLLLPVEFELEGEHLSMFTTLTTFGTPRDVTLEELCVEFFFPADDATEEALRRRSLATA